MGPSSSIESSWGKYFCSEYKWPNLVTNIEFELPFQWENDQIPPFVCLVRQIFIYTRKKIFLLY